MKNKSYFLVCPETYANRANVLPWIWKPQYGEKEAPKRNGRSKQKKFELKTGANLDGTESPDVSGRAFTVTAKIKTHAPKGIIVAQGGTAYGWCIYFKDNQAHFAIRDKSKLSEVVLGGKIPAAPYTLKATMNRGGKVSLSIGKEKATKNLNPISSHPVDGLQVGRDEGGKVVENPSEFLGVIDSVTIEVR